MVEEQTKAESTARLCADISKLRVRIRELEDNGNSGGSTRARLSEQARDLVEDLPDDILGEVDRLGRAMTSAIAGSFRSAADILGNRERRPSPSQTRRLRQALRMNRNDVVLAINAAASPRPLRRPAS